MTDQTFPETVEWKSSTATIYRTKNRDRFRFEVRFYDADGVQRRATFETYGQAKKFAAAVVKELAETRSQFVTLRSGEAHEYNRMKDVLASLKLSMTSAATMLEDIHRILDGRATPVEAVEGFIRHLPRKAPNATVAQIVDEFLAFKQREGEVGRLYIRDLRNRLRNFQAAFQCPVRQVTASEITEYLLKQPGSLRTRKNLRTTIATFFNYARSEGYLPADHPGVPKPTKRRRERTNVQVFTPEEMTKLLEHATPELAVPLAITAFAGIRAEEVKRLTWEHVKLSERHIEVPASLAKTGLRRLVPITDNLAAWLNKFFHHTGHVCVFANLALQYGKLSRKAGVKWKRNALRHSFASYRIAVVRDIPRVAFEAGNSPAVIQREYMKVVTESEANRWFSICPPTMATEAAQRTDSVQVTVRLAVAPPQVIAPDESRQPAHEASTLCASEVHVGR